MNGCSQLNEQIGVSFLEALEERTSNDFGKKLCQPQSVGLDLDLFSVFVILFSGHEMDVRLQLN